MAFYIRYGVITKSLAVILCNNLFCIIDAESEEEIELREMLMEQIKDEPATVEYVHNFLTNREEK